MNKDCIYSAVCTECTIWLILLGVYMYLWKSVRGAHRYQSFEDNCLVAPRVVVKTTETKAQASRLWGVETKSTPRPECFKTQIFLLFYWNILYVCVWCHSTVGVAVSHPSITPLKLNSSRNWQKVKWWVWTVGICLVRPQWSEPSQQVFWQTLRTPSLILLVPANPKISSMVNVDIIKTQHSSGQFTLKICALVFL